MLLCEEVVETEYQGSDTADILCVCANATDQEWEIMLFKHANLSIFNHFCLFISVWRTKNNVVFVERTNVRRFLVKLTKSKMQKTR